MISRFDFGSPIDTGAAVRDLPVSGGSLAYFALSREDHALCFALDPAHDDIIFGLGEAARGINKRCHLYTSWSIDDGMHTKSKHSLYASHNFLLSFGKTGRSAHSQSLRRG